MTDLVNVTKYHNKGYKGKGIKVAIIDGGYEGWRSLSYVNPDHAKSFTGGSMVQLPDNPGGGSHGTGMAQCFHEIAPEAEIYLLKENSCDAVAYGLIKQYCIDEGILLVSNSLNTENYRGDFLTGNDDYSTKLDLLVNSSITVCTIAGNFANSTYFAHLTNDGSGNMIFPNGTPNLNVVVLTTSTFYIEIARTGFQRPTSEYEYRVVNNRTGRAEQHILQNGDLDYGLVEIPARFSNIGDVLSLSLIRKRDSVDYLDIIISYWTTGNFRLQDPVEMNKECSLALPGASKKAITVGAILVSDYNKRDVVSNISGWGPIPEDVDEFDHVVVPYTIKPELCAPSEGGATSPTSPRVAGCLAVLASAGLCDLSKPEETKQYLLANHIVKLSVPSISLGYGRLFLDAATDWPPPVPSPIDPDDKDVLVYPNPISLRSSSGYLKITNLSLDISKLEARIYNINGEFIKSFSILELEEYINKKLLRWDLRNENGDKVAPGVYFISIKTDSGKTQIKKFAVKI
ncbi:MAG: S8 family peptidase [Endomicrobium sp.]|jgi:hypothetical protein|nr:S8 family peptidase [Endomicrobium sp.]